MFGFGNNMINWKFITPQNWYHFSWLFTTCMKQYNINVQKPICQYKLFMHVLFRCREGPRFSSIAKYNSWTHGSRFDYKRLSRMRTLLKNEKNYCFLCLCSLSMTCPQEQHTEFNVHDKITFHSFNTFSSSSHLFTVWF